MTCVRLEHITRTFGQTVALNDIDLSIANGELFFLLGPSGCGKSTLLRLIAGLLSPTKGRILFDDRDVTGLGTEGRNAVMCFQSYALWPHMSVSDNIAFGLEVRKIPRAERKKRTFEMLSLVQMEACADRKPNQLSGGQQQRVALARALAVKPACLLLDEPLSNLDASLRLEMRSEIRRICKAGGFTTIYVTHDQKEALSVADRIAIVRGGTIAQIATPEELYRKPATSFVAGFIGSTNLLSGKLESRDGDLCAVQTAAGLLHATATRPAQPDDIGSSVIISIRPEQIRICGPVPQAAADNSLTGRVIETTFLGDASEHLLDVKGQRIKVVSMPARLDSHELLTVEFSAGDAVVFRE